LIDDLGSSGRAAVIDAHVQVFWILATGIQVASWCRRGAGLLLDEVVAVLPPPAIAHDLDRLSAPNALTSHQKENLCRSTPSP
jgi:zona occludens toxin (predicted ATPase)